MMSKKDDTFEMLDDGPETSKKSIILLLVILVLLVMGGIPTYLQKQASNRETSVASISQPTEKEAPAPTQLPVVQPSAPIAAIVSFEQASATIKPDQMAKLQAFYKSIKDLAGTVQIDGYTDNMGLAEDGLKLSKQRAEAVATYLKSMGSSDKLKFEVASFGENNPVGDNTTELGRQQNRRVELKFIPAP